MHNCKETLTRTGVTFDEGKIVQEFFVCSECGKHYTTINGKLSKVVAPQPSEALMEAEEKKAAQREKAKKYRLEREARIKAAKEKEKAELLQFINSVDTTKTEAVKASSITPKAAPAAPAPSKRARLTEEERKERMRERSRKYYQKKREQKG